MTPRKTGRLQSPFQLDETHGILMRKGVSVRASSQSLAWTTAYASLQEEAPFEGDYPGVADQLLVWHMDGPVAIEPLDGRGRRRTVPSGAIHLIPGGSDFRMRLLGGLNTMHLYIRRAVIEEVAGQMLEGDPGRIEIPSRILEDEPALRSLLQAVQQALLDGDSSTPRYVDHLSRAIAGHLVLRHSLGADRRRSPDRRPTHSVIEAALAFMETHYAEAISVREIAAAANRSAGHFADYFRAAMGMPPHRYLINLRLGKAAEMLVSTTEPIAAIALDCGFAHQEHLTRAFRTRYGTTPAAYRAQQRH